MTEQGMNPNSNTIKARQIQAAIAETFIKSNTAASSSQYAVVSAARNLEDLNSEESSVRGPDVLYSFETKETPKPLSSPQIREAQREHGTSLEKPQAGCCLKIH
uniref:SMP domain-containing protein n=1 Tax=Salix viminalis TaxID=40686 RepID=A0A6N2MTT1_SALVM